MRRNFFTLIVFVFISSCSGTRDLSNTNLSSFYRNAEILFHPEFSIYHYSNDSSKIIFRINTNEFLSVRQSDDHFRAYFLFHYSLVESYETPTIMDSASHVFEVEQQDEQKIKLNAINFKIAKPGNYLLVCNLRDLNKNVEEHFYINIDNSSKECRQSFFVSEKKSSAPLFRNYISEKDSVRIQFTDTSVKNISVRYYQRDFPLAPAPFSFDVHESFDYLPDSTFTASINDSEYHDFAKPGFYHFQTDTTEKNGLTLFRFDGNFPSVTTPDQMLEAMRYICSKNEYEELKANKNHKAAMDKFWLGVGGNAERTKMLIKKYYTRIQEANKYFTSYTEGWRTDRGMLYTIFGKPNNVYKSSNTENWIYGQPNNILSLNFLFIRVDNPFSDNDYTLSRAPIYEGNWYRAVDVWRSGRVYNDF